MKACYVPGVPESDGEIHSPSVRHPNRARWIYLIKQVHENVDANLTSLGLQRLHVIPIS